MCSRLMATAGRASFRCVVPGGSGTSSLSPAHSRCGQMTVFSAHDGQNAVVLSS